MLAARRMMIAAHTCNPGLLTLPYSNTFTGSFDATWVSCDGSTWAYDGSGNLQCTTLDNGTTTYDGTAKGELFADTGVEEIDVTVTWGAQNNNTLHFVGFYFNYLDDQNYWMIRGDEGAAQLWKVVAGVATNISGIGKMGPGAGDQHRVIISNGMVFVHWLRNDGFVTALVHAGDVIPGGTLIGFLTYDVDNLIADVTIQEPLYYHNHGTLSAGGSTGVIDAGSQRQATIFRVASDNGSSGTQAWSICDNSENSIADRAARWQPADSSGANNFAVELLGGTSFSIRAGGAVGGSAGLWYANVVFGSGWWVFKSSDGVTWTVEHNPGFTNSLTYDNANTYYQVALSANHSFDHTQTWAFAE